MRGFWHHLGTSTRLNFRNPQALVFGYLVPIFFLIAFGSYYGSGKSLGVALGQVLTISILGGTCFGMPIAFVNERERGVWRRCRLTPLPTVWFVASMLLGRFVIILSSALLQIALAMTIYHMPAPKNPVHLAVGFTCASFAFLGLGLVIAMVANSTAAVQALGQSLFLPMIILGGVGVPLSTFKYRAPWVYHVAAFLPGRYAVLAMDRGVLNFEEASKVVQKWGFNLAVLLIIGAASCLAGAKLFRWENNQRFGWRTIAWVMLAVATWLAAGFGAEYFRLIG